MKYLKRESRELEKRQSEVILGSILSHIKIA